MTDRPYDEPVRLGTQCTCPALTWTTRHVGGHDVHRRSHDTRCPLGALVGAQVEGER